MARFTDAEGSAIINNTMMRMGEYSLIAQTVKGHSTSNPVLYSGIAHALEIKIDTMVSKYGNAITGEALEEAVQNLPDIDNPALYYRTSDEETNDMQEEYFDQLEDQLDRLAENLQKEEQRIAEEQAREEERRRQEQENRERAREQAERARETEQRYKQMEEQPKQPSGIFGRVGSFIRGLFRRGR